MIFGQNLVIYDPASGVAGPPHGMGNRMQGKTMNFYQTGSIPNGRWLLAAGWLAGQLVGWISIMLSFLCLSVHTFPFPARSVCISIACVAAAVGTREYKHLDVLGTALSLCMYMSLSLYPFSPSISLSISLSLSPYPPGQEERWITSHGSKITRITAR